jgi:phenylacetate-coenzyme A ligase PaaK-like adenylate-forming protein
MRESGLIDRIKLRHGILGAEAWSEAMRQNVFPSIDRTSDSDPLPLP